MTNRLTMTNVLTEISGVMLIKKVLNRNDAVLLSFSISQCVEFFTLAAVNPNKKVIVMMTFTNFVLLLHISILEICKKFAPIVYLSLP